MKASDNAASRGAGDVLAAGFGTTVAMWAVGYLARLPVVLAPPSFVLALLLAVMIAGGFIAVRRGATVLRGGFLAGGLTGLLNLLVLGSFLSNHERPDALIPTAAAWLPGSIAVSSLLAGFGAWLASRTRTASAAPADWTAALAKVAVGATLLLLVAGGLVTSNKAGLAVVDWPRSYGYNMFLYPFSRMTGGIYYEHAHRLLGALVGLTTLALAVHLMQVERRAIVKRLAAAAVVLVVAQGILGGLRVTERNLYLAVAHGVTAQLFFSLLVAIAVLCSRSWMSDRSPRESVAAAGLSRLASIAVIALAAQIVLGAIQRHLAFGLVLHMVAAAVVGWLTITTGVRTWASFPDVPVLRRAGLAVAYATGTQIMLGFCAWIARGAATSGAISPDWKVVVTTLHQGTGAVLLALTVALRLWLYLASGAQPSAR